MTTKSDNEKKAVAKQISTPAQDTSKKNNSKLAKVDEDDEDEDDLESTAEPKKTNSRPKGSKKKTKDDEDDDDDEAEVEVDDEWEKPEEGDAWDPDFDEFDVPKSKGKKAGTKKTDEDDLKIDDDFKEFGLFDDMNGGGGFDDDDDF